MNDTPDSQAVPDQHPGDDAVPPPSKVARRSKTSPKDAAAAASPPMSEIEAERAARIAANKARLAELELPQLAAGLAAAAGAVAAQPRKLSAAALQRGVTTKRSKAEALPQRQSARARGQAPDLSYAGGIQHEGRDGRVVLAAFVPERYGSVGRVIDPSDPSATAAAAAAAARPPPGPLTFSSSNGDEGTDAAFLQQLQAFAAAPAGRAAGGCAAANSSGGVLGAERLKQLQLQPVDIAKLTTQGVSCLAFHPSSSKPIIAAADKSGKVGLWDVDHPSAGDDSSAYDGVLLFEPHRDYVSSMKWLGPSGSALLTGSYDGIVRQLDVETGVWGIVGGVPDDLDECNWSAGDATPDGSTVFLATSEGQFSLMDTRTANSSSVAPHLTIANRKVNTLQLHSDGVHLLSSASDGTVAVWDVRQLEQQHSSGSSGRPKTCKPVAAAHHTKSSQGAYWEPGGGPRVLSVSFDDTLKIWELGAGSLTQQVSIRHNNNTGRWVMPFRAVWAPAGDAVCVGDLKRGVSVFKDSGAPVCVLSAEPLTAIPSRLAMHPQGLMAAATSSGRVHVFR